MADEVRKIAKLKVRRGPEANLPTLDEGEPGLALDTERIFFGTGKKNIEVAKKTEVNQMKTDLTSDINKVDSKLVQANRQTQALSQGLNIVNSEYNTPLDIQIEGRTLVSLGNSDLEDGKYYVLADKKTKVKAFKDDVWKAGVTKFQRENSITAKMDLVGKVAGSTAENPHKTGFRVNSTNLVNPDSYTEEANQSRINSMATLNGGTDAQSFTGAGYIASRLFSFNVVEQIERKMGLIPRATLAEKVQWIKDNVDRVTFNWWGKGTGPSGNKASLNYWSTSSWGAHSSGASHTSSSITKLTSSVSSSIVDTNGFVHYVAFADAATASVPSVLETDYVDFSVTLVAANRLNKRPILSRIANFEGKVAGSTIENPHIAKANASQNSLQTPSSANLGEFSGGYNSLVTTDNVLASSQSPLTSGFIAQHLFTFNVIEEVERNLGKIPRTTVASKAQWLRENVASIIARANVRGSSPTGNKASMRFWNGSTWLFNTSHTLAGIGTLANGGASSVTSYVMDDGTFNVLCFAEPSDGVAPSILETDYIELVIDMKPEAELWHPSVPLYEVPLEDYNKILVDWNEAEVQNRYPQVQGVQHIQNPYVIAEGDNILPPFWEWSLHANATVKSAYELELNSTGTWQSSGVTVRVLPNTNYFMRLADNTRYAVADEAGSTTGLLPYGSGPRTFNSGNRTRLKVFLSNENVSTPSKYVFSQPMLTLGAVGKPFVPRNPSYLLVEAKIGSIGVAKDRLYFEDGSYKIRKEVEKDLQLDGTLAYLYNGTRGSIKEIGLPVEISTLEACITNHKGVVLTKSPTFGSVLQDGNQFRIFVNTKRVYVSVTDEESGWASVTPDEAMVKRYFNGWKYTDGTTWQSVTGNGQTATAALALTSKPSDYVPYRISYALSTTKVETSVKAQGDIIVSGQTVVEVGTATIVNEKAPFATVTPTSTRYYLNNSVVTASKLKYRLENLIGVYKNGSQDISKTLTRDTNNAYGKFCFFVEQADFDPTATYTISYIALDKQMLTGPATSLRATFANNVRSALDDVVTKQADQGTMVSLNTRAILDLYVRMKALEGGAK